MGDIKLMSNYNNKIYNYKISKSSPNLVSVGLTYSENSSINTLILNSNGQIISSSSKISLYTNSDKKTFADINFKSSVSDTLISAKSLNINESQKIGKILIDRISHSWATIPKTSQGLPLLINSFSSTHFKLKKYLFDSTSYDTGMCRTIIFILQPVDDTNFNVHNYEFFAQPTNSIVYYEHNYTEPVTKKVIKTYPIYNYITDIECETNRQYSHGDNSHVNEIRVVVNYFSNYYPNINDSMYENANLFDGPYTKIDFDKKIVTPGVVQTSFDLLLIEKVT